MALGSVQVNALNLQQGAPNEVEKYFLFIGTGATNADSIVHLNTDSDLDVELGSATSVIKTNVAAARLNAGQNWNAVAFPLGAATWEEAVDIVVAAHIVVEAIVICDPISAQQDLLDMQVKAVELWAGHAIRVFFIATTAAIDPLTQTWAQYTSALAAFTTSVVAERVTVAPQIFDDSIGVYAGRLANSSISVADSPMRVATGALVGKAVSSFPVDSADVAYNNAHAEALNNQRFSVPQTYHGYEGIYFTDGQTLDTSTGDYAVIENLRVVDMLARKLYLILVGMVANRSINSTPVSMAYATNKLMQPLYQASKSTEFQGIPFPGEIEPPKDGDVKLVWATRTKLVIYHKATPYKAPKAIEDNIILDLSNPV